MKPGGNKTSAANVREILAAMEEEVRRVGLGEARQAHELAALAGRDVDGMRRGLERWNTEG